MDNHKLIEIAAQLQEAAAQDDRLKALSEEATKLVLQDPEALTALFNAYLHPPTPSPPQPQLKQPQSTTSNPDIAQATAILEKFAKELRK